MRRILFVEHFPRHGLFVGHRPPHARHADPSRQISKALKRREIMSTWFQRVQLRKSFWVWWRDRERGESDLTTCCMILGNSEQRAFRPLSSRIFSRVISWRAIRVVSSISRPAWFVKVNTGEACKKAVILARKPYENSIISYRKQSCSN